MPLTDVNWPLRGYERKTSFQGKSDNTTPGSTNVIPDGQFDGRTRGGVRPGLSKRYTDGIGGFPTFLVTAESATRSSGDPVRYLVAGSTNGVSRSTSTRTPTSTLLTSLKAYWTLKDSYDSHTNNHDLTYNGSIGHMAGRVGDGLEGEADATKYMSSTTDFSLSPSAAWSLSIWFNADSLDSTSFYRNGIACYATAGSTGDWVILAANSSGFAGTMAFVHFREDEPDGTGTHRSSANVLTVGKWHHFVVTHTAAGVYTQYLDGESFSTTRSTTGTTWDNMGFRIGGSTDTDSGTRNLDGVIDEFGIWDKVLTEVEVEELYNFGRGRTYPFRTDTVTYSDTMESMTGILVDENNLPILDHNGEEITTSGFNIGLTRKGSAASLAETVLVADTETDLATGTGSIVSTNKLVAPAVVPDWTELGIDVADHYVQISALENEETESGSYAILSVSATELELDPTANEGNNITNGGVTFTVGKAPKVIDTDNGSVDILRATKGFVPIGVNLVAVYRDRAVWVKDRTWFMSRQGNINDYDYSADASDSGRAVAGTVDEAGQPGEPIIALAPSGDDYIVFFAEDSTWVVRGDPAYGGQIDNLSRVVGAVDSEAWTHGPSGEIYFLSKDGLFLIPPGAAGTPQPVSQRLLPSDLKDQDKENFETSLVYDIQNDGLYIFVTPLDAGTTQGTHYFYDFDTDSFWQLKFASNDHQPIAAVSFSSDPTKSQEIVLACNDGFLRTLDDSDDDDGTSIASDIILGPYRSSDEVDTEAIINRIAGTTGVGSGSVTVELYVGDDAESVADAAIAGTNPNETVTWTAGRNKPFYPRRRGAAFALKLKATSVWAFEGAAVEATPAGRQRL